MADSPQALHDRLEKSAFAFEVLEAAYLKLANENRSLKDALTTMELKLLDQSPTVVTAEPIDLSSALLQEEVQALNDQVAASQVIINAQEASIARLEEAARVYEMELLDVHMQLEMKSLDKTPSTADDQEPLTSPFFAVLQATVQAASPPPPPSGHPYRRAQSLTRAPILDSEAAHEARLDAAHWQRVAQRTSQELMSAQEELACHEQVAASLRHVIEHQATEHALTTAAHRDAIQSLKEKLDSQRARLDVLSPMEAALTAATSRLRVLEAAVATDILTQLNEKDLALQSIQTTLRQHTLLLNTRGCHEKSLAAQVAIFCNDVATRVRQLVLETETLKDAKTSLMASSEAQLQRIKELKGQVQDRDAILRVLQVQVHPTPSSHIRPLDTLRASLSTPKLHRMALVD
ncbi:hypothetical protein SPRG_14628 [Saprolegnia parasitica CBS 223.65]|uniref:Uncharacterized protein n=1 Tax=Saprolegnia parasitica (strain CBS 223.65) TaxID=695850 RepID=A0A067BNM3_SAPPC|nr:hypothetical protein SPRG_14628 [Saprolegnia parasitica CBS 223.65]KDO20089.1 hypothetical protein SPRG_14628 [Saprolegnia parasitica CBS 223.65]|eukprot:XP_012209192.1 hypothetical protein SPRG_14628 [Saprolegnia parasitica CBS 223.65]